MVPEVKADKADEGIPPSDRELGKRLGAGRGYALKTRAAFARDLGVPAGDIEAWEKGEFGSSNRPNNTGRKREDAVSRVQTASGLPVEFFSLDLDLRKLPDMLTAWKQVRSESPSETAAALETDEDPTLPADPSDSQSEEPTP
jgi:hypothetical protein